MFLVVKQISRIGGRERVGLEQTPIHNVAIAVISARPINARPDFGRPSASQTKVVRQIIKVLKIDSLSDGWVQHGVRSLRWPKNSAAMPPSIDYLKGLMRIDYHIRTLRLNGMQGARCKEKNSNLSDWPS
jgi:hypothetical protein